MEGESLETLTVQSHAPRGHVYPLYWLQTPFGQAALKSNEDTVRRWVRRLIGRPRGR